MPAGRNLIASANRSSQAVVVDGWLRASRNCRRERHRERASCDASRSRGPARKW
jgi:hypothetical protein